MTEKDLLSMKAAMEKAEKDDTPFLVQTENESTVVGDINKTEKKICSYSVLFRIPIKYAEGFDGAISKDGKYKLFRINYEDITVTPRNEIYYKGLLLEIIKYFRLEDEHGELRQITRDETIELFYLNGAEVLNKTYDFVGKFLGVDEGLFDMMDDGSVIENFDKILSDFPELYNGSDIFFG